MCKIFNPADAYPAARFPYNPKVVMQTILRVSLYQCLMKANVKANVKACTGTFSKKQFMSFVNPIMGITNHILNKIPLMGFFLENFFTLNSH